LQYIPFYLVSKPVFLLQVISFKTHPHVTFMNVATAAKLNV